MSMRRPNDGSRRNSRETKGAGVEEDGYYYEVEVTVVSAEGLRRVAWFGENQAVAVAWVHPLAARRTGVARDGGSGHPVWNERLLVPLRRDQLLTSSTRTTTWALKVQILHHHHASFFCARLRHPIGTAIIPAAHIFLHTSVSAASQEHANNVTTSDMIMKYPLRGFLGRPHGALNLIVRLHNYAAVVVAPEVHPPPPPPPLKTLPADDQELVGSHKSLSSAQETPALIRSHSNNDHHNYVPMTAPPGGTTASVLSAPPDPILLPNSSTISADRPPIYPQSDPWASRLTPNVVYDAHSTLDFPSMPTAAPPTNRLAAKTPLYSNSLPRPEPPGRPQLGEAMAPAAAVAASGGLLPHPTAPPAYVYMDPKLRRRGPGLAGHVDMERQHEPAATSSQPIPIPIPTPGNSHKKGVTNANANANEQQHVRGWTPSPPGNMNQTPDSDRSWPVFPLSAGSFTAAPRNNEKQSIAKINGPSVKTGTSSESKHDVPLHGHPISPHHQYDLDDHHNPVFVDDLYSPYHEAYARDMENCMHHVII